MLTRLFLSYVAGVATMGVAHYSASGTPGNLRFAMGILSPFLVLALNPLGAGCFWRFRSPSRTFFARKW